MLLVIRPRLQRTTELALRTSQAAPVGGCCACPNHPFLTLQMWRAGAIGSAPMCPMSGRQVPGGEAGRGAQGEESAGEPIRTCQNTYQNLPEPARTYPNLSEPIRTRQRRSGAYQTAGKPPLTLQVSCPHVMWRASMAFRCPSGGCPRTHTWRHLGGLQVIWAASRRTPRVGLCLYECRP